MRLRRMPTVAVVVRLLLLRVRRDRGRIVEHLPSFSLHAKVDATNRIDCVLFGGHLGGVHRNRWDGRTDRQLRRWKVCVWSLIIRLDFAFNKNSCPL